LASAVTNFVPEGNLPRYRLRVTIPKPGGDERPLGIPTIRDRVVQAVAKIVLEPIFEADFKDSAYGYRPRRAAAPAFFAARMTSPTKVFGRGSSRLLVQVNGTGAMAIPI
jgi:hypothetical protein